MTTTWTFGRSRFLLPLAILLPLIAVLLFAGEAGAQTDTTAPTFESAIVVGSKLVLTYNEALNEDSTPAASSYYLSIAGGADVAPSSVKVVHDRVELTLASAATFGQSVTVAYVAPFNNVLEDVAGNDAANLDDTVAVNRLRSTNNVLVKNTAQSLSTGSFGNERAQYFTTGDNPAGYRLNTVGVRFHDASYPVVPITIRAVDSSNRPTGPDLYTLNAPSSQTVGLNTYTAPTGTNLDPNTTYSLVFNDNSLNNSPNIYVNITGNDEDPSLGGWSIGNNHHRLDSGSWQSNSSSIAIEIKGIALNNDPEFDESSITLSIDEDASGFQPIGDPPTAFDEDLDTLAFTKSGGDLFTINATTGQISLKASSVLDHETASHYTFTVSVKDKFTSTRGVNDSDDDDINVRVNVGNVDEPETLTIRDTTLIAGDIIFTDFTEADNTYNVNYSWETADSPTGTFSPAGNDADIGTYSPVEEDIGKYLRATVMYNDGFGRKTLSTPAYVVLRGNSEPTFNDGSSTSRSVDENVSTGTNVGTPISASDTDLEGGVMRDTLVYSLTGGADRSRFTIVSSSGQLRTNVSLNYESKSTYTVVVSVRDNKNSIGNTDSSNDASITVTINVNNVNEAGMVAISGTEEGGSTLTATITDPDGSITSRTYRWMRGDTATGTFTNITSNATSQTYRLVAADVGKYIKVRSTYKDGQSTTATRTVTSSATGEIDEKNSSPTFDDGATAGRAVNEHKDNVITAGVNVGSAVGASDDENDTLTYWVNTTAPFTVVSTSGQLQTKAGQNLDHEVLASYTVIVRVTDGIDAAGDSVTNPMTNDIDDTISVTVTINDVNETPTFSSGTAGTAVPENTSTSQILGNYTISDPDDGDVFSWTVESSDDGARFNVEGSGKMGDLKFSQALNFEDPQQAGATDNEYKVTLKVTDSGGLTDTYDTTVRITNVNETPVFDSGPTSANFNENQATSTVVATYEASDVDAETTLTWTLEGDDRNDFTLTDEDSDGEYEVRFNVSPNYEDPHDLNSDGDFKVTVKVTDNGIPGSRGSTMNVTRDLTITLVDVNDPPVVSGEQAPSEMETEFDVPAGDEDLDIVDYNYTDEDVPADTITWSISGTDASDFTIDSSTGELSFSGRPNFEEPTDRANAAEMHVASNNVYHVIVRANDGAATTEHEVTVTVTNVNETPEIVGGVDDLTDPEYAYNGVPEDTAIIVFTPRDEESDAAALTFSLGGTDHEDFEITVNAAGQGTLSYKVGPNFEEPTDRADTDFGHIAGDNKYELILWISDDGHNSRYYPMTITVSDVNEAPDIIEDFDPPQTYVEIEYDIDTTVSGALPPVHTFSAVDYDEGDTFTWSLDTTDPDAAHLSIDPDTGVLTFDQDAAFGQGPLPNFEHPRDDTGDGTSNTYTITVQATDDNHPNELTTEYAVVVTVTNVNEQPSFTGTPPASATPDENDANTTYDGETIVSYTAHDQEGGVTWRLTGTDAGDFTISTNGEVTFRQAPNFEDPDDANDDNEYRFTVVVTDVETASSPRRSASQDVIVTVQDVEEAGTVTIRAGDESPGVDDTVTFILSDPDGLDANPYIEYSVQRGLNNFTQVTSGALSGTSYTYTVLEADAGRKLRVVITYDDRRGSGKTATSAATDTVTADPRANVPPRIRSTGTVVAEGPAIINIGTIEATDRDGDTITFALLNEQDSSYFQLSSRGRLQAIRDLDFEDDDTLLINFTISDGKGLDSNGNVINDSSVDDTGTFQVFVRDLEEEGTITFSPQEPEAGAAQTATVEDGDGQVSVQSWQWERSANSNGPWTAISGATSATYTASTDDEGFYFRVTATYTDRRGGNKSAVQILGPVPSENRRPTFPTTETGARTIAENSRTGANIGAAVAATDPERNRLTYSLTGTDADAFTIVTTTGQIRVKDALDYESKALYRVTVNVHDGLDGSGATSTTIDATKAVTITIENVDEPGVVTLTSMSQSIQARVAVTASLEDDDVPTSVMWQWSRATSSRGPWVTIAGATQATFTPADTDAGNYIRATASYNDGEDTGKTAQAVSPRVGQPPPINSKPAFPATERGQREIPENTAGGTNVGAPFTATDINMDTLIYTLSGTDASLFTIDSNGQLKVATDAELDFESKRSLRLTVEVSDGADALDDPDNNAIDDRQSVTVTLTDVNEAPVVTGDTSPSYQEDANTVIATYSAADPERDTLTWTTSGSSFYINSRGQLYFRSPPSFEGTTSYTVAITAEDEEGLSDSITVSVTVTDAEEPGVVTISPPRGWANDEDSEPTNLNSTFTANLSDDDGGVTGTSWQWSRSTNRSSWTDIAGATGITYTLDDPDVGNYLRATASYTDRRSSNKTASAILPTRIADLDDKPTANVSPEFAETSYDRSIGQGGVAGRNVGAPVRATDEDRDEVLTYSLTGSDSGKFDIDPATGQIKTRDALDYDPNGTNTYSVSVQVSDGFDSAYSPSPSVDATTSVTITVTQVTVTITTGTGGGGGGGGFGAALIAPKFVDGFRTTRPLAQNARPGDAIGDPVAATHPNDDDVTFSLSGANASLFTVDELTGQIRLGADVSLVVGQTYTVNLTATDESGTGAIIIIVIEVVEGLADPYDLNGNGSIEKNEVIMAVADYFAGEISKEEILALLSRYFAG